MLVTIIFLFISFTIYCIYPEDLAQNISRGHYMCLPCKIYRLAFAWIKVIIHIMPLSFCHDVAYILENSYANLQIFQNNTIRAIYF